MIFIAARRLPSSGLGDLVRALAELLAERTEEDALKNQIIFLSPQG